ncbi:MAG: alpha-ketoacid dehydrogenase subunit beta [Actinobacteria bacterium]|nr:alpha-ketoacid dehydrogenase subunit beta [Actinomycetota bacterium]
MKIKYRDALNQAISEEMRKDKNLVILGEDIACGYEGCFGVTAGLFNEFGGERVVDTPISEAGIIGTAIGASMLGMKTIAEIMFEDFITVCFDGIVNQAAKLRIISGNQYNLNMVVRTPGGAGGLGAQHSQCLESIFMHFPGLYIAIPSNAYDAKGLLKTAINLGDPVIFFEHQKLYNTEYEVPQEEYYLPFGKANLIKEGKDLSIVSFSNMVNTALEAIREIENMHGISIELIDPRTLVPFDYEMLTNSVRKTNKLIIIEEGVLRSGTGSEISAEINERCFDYLDYPVKRIASKNFLIPLNPVMEKNVIPGKERIIKEILEFLSLN